jgi:hypothetical protein
MTTQQEAKELLKKHGTVAAAARAAGLPRMTFVGRLKGSVPKNTLGRRDSRVAAVSAKEARDDSIARKTAVTISGTVSLDSVLGGFDVVGQLIAIVKALPAGTVKKDEDLRMDLQVGDEKWRRVRKSERVSGYVYRLPDGAWVWGNKATIASIPGKLREWMI